ncbi:hypothetical protein C7974DRAFT_289651, partial [Boeremia exigua]|uniref:uncharacterized protein n=1 Tax=Boeremia exigua TaxID=749465 RepID=UPI001E8D4E31
MKLPYLKAVVQELLRVCPTLAVPMLRFAPSFLMFRQIGMNAMVVQFDMDVFGEYAHKFRPER